MSITLFAQGTIEPFSDISRLIDEVIGIAVELGWKYHVIDDDFDALPDAVLTHDDPERSGAVIKGSLGLKGVVLNVEQGVESLAILFDRSGVLTDIMQQLAWIENNRHGERFTICKTQFGSIDSHIQIIELFDRLK